MARGAQRACALFACAIGALATFEAPAGAQTRTVSQVERDRRAEAARAEQLRREANTARAEVAALDTRLRDAGRRREEADTAIIAAAARLTELERQIAADDRRRRRTQEALESALIAAAFSERRAEHSAVRVGIFARAAAPALADAQRRTAQNLTLNRQLASTATEERSVLADAQAAIDAERGELVTMQARRRATQTALARDATAAERRVRTLVAEARTLRELAQRVQRASATAPRQAAGPSVIPASWLAPAQGSIMRAYGVREGAAPATQGALLRTRAGAAVVSPGSGEVAYAGAFRSYGNVLILNLDGGYAVVLTGLDAIGARVGDTVRAGQTVGQMAASDTPAPELYVEVRRAGQPVDPGRWLNARGLTAERTVRTG